MTQPAKQNGFTLVELMLAIAFVGFVILFTVLAIIQVMRTYSKGLSVKEINQTARSTVEDMARVARGARTVNNSAVNEGRLCFGGVSYVWNYQNQTTNVYDNIGNSAVTLARVDDPGDAMCAAAAGVYPEVPEDDSTQLLSNQVWVHMLDVQVNTNNDVATITLQLSTTDDPGNPTLEDPFPGTPPDPSDSATWVRCSGVTGSEFCSVATFTTSVATRGNE